MNTLIVLLPIAVVALAGCNNATSADLKNVPYAKPDSIKVWENIDGHPNIARLCLDGVAFATTSRDASAAAAQRVPDWDRLCPGSVAK